MNTNKTDTTSTLVRSGEQRDDVAKVVASLCDQHVGRIADGIVVNVDGTMYIGAVEVTAGVVDDNARTIFRQGQCHALALAVAETTQWDIMGHFNNECCYDEDCADEWDIDGYCGCQLQHLYTADTNGWLYDIVGQHDPEGVVDAEYDSEHVAPITARQLHAICSGDPCWRTPRIDVARSFVTHILNYQTNP